MSLLKRTLTAIVMMAVGFVIIQYAPRPVMFLVNEAIVLACLFELFKLGEKVGLAPARGLGAVLAVIFSVPFYFGAVPLELALFAGLLLAGVYYVAGVNKPEKVPAFTGSIALTFFAAGYLSLTLNYLYRIRTDFGPYHIYFLFAILFLGDTGAMFIGRALGRHKMAPVASPHKTWEGSVGGLLLGIGGAILALYVLRMGIPVWKAVVTGVLVQAAAQVSDPLESLFKRAAGVKDSSNALPGHGGFLDRFDSMILSTPLIYYLIIYFWK